MAKIATKPKSATEPRAAFLKVDLYRFIRTHQDKPKRKLTAMIRDEFAAFTPEEIQAALKSYLD